MASFVSFVSLCVLAQLASALVQPQALSATPFGQHYSECVVQVESGSIVSEEEGGLRISSPTKGSYVVPVNHTKCRDSRVFVGGIPGIWRRKSSLSEVGLPDGWLDYADWQPDKESPGLPAVTRFDAMYSVPSKPPESQEQIVFYFIGLQNLKYGETGTILQPVLDFGQTSQKEWGMSSWFCCPKGAMVQSKPFTGIGVAVKINTSISAVFTAKNISSAPNKYRVSSRLGDKDSSIVADTSKGYTFNWLCATLEINSVGKCSQLPQSPMTFSEMSAEIGGKAVELEWPEVTSATGCSGSIQVSSANRTIEISHGG